MAQDLLLFLGPRGWSRERPDLLLYQGGLQEAHQARPPRHEPATQL
jgi:hypothetical protein